MKTFLAQNQFNSVDGSPPSPTVSTADSECRLQNVARPDATAEREPHPISEPSMTNGGDQETPASAPSKNPDVGVLDSTDHIHEIFHWVRKLMTGQPAFVLDEAAFMADVEEVPLFIREDGYLKRQA